MSELSDYLLGQTQHKLNSIESKLDDQTEAIEELQETVGHAKSWAQRLVWLTMAIAGAAASNYNPDRVGELVAAALRAAK